jgi:tetratricopeptide (TPR) repeat protein
MLAMTGYLAFTPSVWAAGGGGGGGGGGGAGGGEQAVRVTDPDFQAGMAAVKRQDWNQVVGRMTAYNQRSPRNADAWNELGHAYRKLGYMDDSFKSYSKALEIDPKHKDAHEYLGEAYLQIGDLARAEQELKTLNSLCLLTCEQYRELKAEIQRYKAAHSTASAR